jgi:hypothetical protein
MGTAPRFRRPTVRICAWCPDKGEAEMRAAARGYDVTHGICAACADKLMKEIYREDRRGRYFPDNC